MLQIKRATLREIQLPLVEPFTISSGTESMRRIGLVEVEDHEGFIGWGECVAGAFPNYNSEAIDTAWIALTDWILPITVGASFDKPADIYPMLASRMRGNEMARATIEMAAYDLCAHRKGVSLSRFLGGTRDKVATGISVGIQDSPAILVEKVGGYIKEGYKKIKIKIKPGYDLPYVAAVREAYGSAVSIMVDANNAYTLADMDTLKKLDALNLLMIEQPFAWDDVVQHAKVQRELNTPVCLDESITKVERAQDMVELKSGRIINIKPGRVGGFASSIAIHDYAEAHGIPVWCGGMLESGIGRAHNVALASLPNFTLPGDISPSRRYWAQDIVKPEWTMEDGMLTVPVDKSGIGVEVDLDRIDDLTVRRVEI
ncbi:MAG: o-succinylbenzoate synthase [Rhodothermales bacterium]